VSSKGRDLGLVGLIIGFIALWIFVGAIPLILLCAPLLIRRERRQWRKLARQGRAIEWNEASRRAAEGTGTFVVRRAYPWGFADLWFLNIPFGDVDPSHEMPQWSESPRVQRRMSRAGRDRIESLARSAMRVRFRRRERKRASSELEKLPCIECDHFAHVARTGKLSNPFTRPFDDPSLEALRRKRDRLLDLRDEHFGTGELEAARRTHEQITAIERALRAAQGSPSFNSAETVSCPPAAPINSGKR
jgi:hypothetical protein